MFDQYLQHLMALIGSNRIFESYEFMKSLPANTPIPNKHNLFSELESKVNRARAHTREVNRLLKKAAHPKALENLIMAQRLVPDFPNIQNDINFIEGTIANLQQSLNNAELAAKRGQQKRVREYLDTVAKIDKTNMAISRINRKLQKSMGRRKARNILLTALVILTPFIYCGYEQFSFLRSNSQWHMANTYIARNEYQLAKLEMDRAEDSLQHVHLLNQVEKVKIIAIITNMTESSRFQQGLQGNVLHNGQFMPRNTKEQLEQIANLSQKADLNVAGGNWTAALNDYQGALDIALADEIQHQVIIGELQGAILQMRDNLYNQYEERGWASFRVMVSQADILVRERRWAEAMDYYDDALRLARENRLSDYEAVSRISNARHRAEIHNCLDEARARLALNNELEAHHIFERIITLSQENDLKNLAATAIAWEMIAKIDKNIFLEQIRGLEEKAGKLRLEKKYQEALAHYQELLSEVTANADTYQLNLAGQKKIAEDGMAEINRQLVVSNQYSYLLSTYKNILRKNFNLSKNIRLQQPKVVFLRDDNNVLLYKVTALGTQGPNASAPHTKYEIDYKFDMATGAWSLNDTPTS